jgi:hypothetical protein
LRASEALPVCFRSASAFCFAEAGKLTTGGTGRHGERARAS